MVTIFIHHIYSKPEIEVTISDEHFRNCFPAIECFELLLILQSHIVSKEYEN